MAPRTCKLLQRLSDEPVQGVSMANVICLRLDEFDALAPGNKHFKLQPYLQEAKTRGINTLLTFGGAWSNHLHALAACGNALGLNTVGIVRGEHDATAMLADAERWGMVVHRVSYGEYRRRDEAGYLADIQRRFGPCILIPEGGADSRGARGAMSIVDLLPAPAEASRLVLGVGTGATLAGISAASTAQTTVTGIAALKPGAELEDRVSRLLATLEAGQSAPWEILYDYHCGGFARVSPALEAFQADFEAVQGIPLEPVYTAKVFFAVHDLLRRGHWPADESICVIHTGGLQGRRGFSLPAPPARHPER